MTADTCTGACGGEPDCIACEPADGVLFLLIVLLVLLPLAVLVPLCVAVTR